MYSARRVIPILLLAIVGLVVMALPASAGQSTGGSAAITRPLDPGAPLRSGGSQTPWSFALPSRAGCSGDTAHKAYHVFAYIVPVGVDPATLSFNTLGPSKGFPLVDASGSGFMEFNTAVDTGQIVRLPAFKWSVFSTDGRNGTQALAPGVYNTGIACANTLGRYDRHWNAQVTFAANAADPNGLTWTAQALAPVKTSGSSSGFPVAVVVVVGVVVVLGGGFLILRLRRSGALRTA